MPSLCTQTKSFQKSYRLPMCNSSEPLLRDTSGHVLGGAHWLRVLHRWRLGLVGYLERGISDDDHCTDDYAYFLSSNAVVTVGQGLYECS